MTAAIVILAGGAGRRMGGANKALLELGGRPLLAHLLGRLQAPGPVAIAAHAAAGAEALRRFGLPILIDGFADHRGPLAGVLAGLSWRRQHHPESSGLVSLPVDCPFLPPDIARRLSETAKARRAQVVHATCGGTAHYACAWWAPELDAPLRRVVGAAEELAIRRFTQGLKVVTCDFPAAQSGDFRNLNTPSAMMEAERSLEAARG
jgi:molybdopterin-guanine dinucleotide biosynthesis protein A